MIEIKHVSSLDNTLSYNLIPFRNSGRSCDHLNYRRIENCIRFKDNYYIITHSDIANEFLIQLRTKFNYFSKNNRFKLAFFTLIDNNDTIHLVFTTNNKTYQSLQDHLLSLVSEDKTYQIKAVAIKQTSFDSELVKSITYQQPKYSFEEYMKMVEPLNIQSSIDKFVKENTIENKIDEFKDVWFKNNHYIGDEKSFSELIDKWKKKIKIKKIKKVINEIP